MSTFLLLTLAAKQSSLEYGQDLPVVRPDVFLYADIEIDSIETVSAGCTESLRGKSDVGSMWRLPSCYACHYRICMYLPDSQDMAGFCCSYTISPPEQKCHASGDKLVSIQGFVIPQNPKPESVKRWPPGTQQYSLHVVGFAHQIHWIEGGNQTLK